MKHWILLLACCAGFLTGCGQKFAENVDPDQAGQALRTALDAWKDGKSNSDLQGQTPPIVMNESDWTAGGRLLDYKMNDSGVLDGRQIRWVVQIKVQDKTGKVSDKKATYVIDTIPRVVIVRDTFAQG